MSLTYNEQDAEPIAYDDATQEIIFFKENSPDQKITEAIGDFRIIPNIVRGFENVFCFGASGSGKSYAASEYALSYRRIFPNNNIFMFSQKSEDPAFEVRDKTSIKEVLNLRRIKVDDSFLQKNIDVTKDFKNCLVMFDDFMYFDNKRLVEKIINIIIQVLNLGRSLHIFSVITSHLIYSQGDGKRHLYANIQNEVHKMIFFKSVNVFQLNYCLKNYWGFSSSQIKKLLKIDDESRFTCINKYPCYAVTKHRVVLL